MSASRADLKEIIERIGADSVYFLMHPGYSKEVRSNRWHYASRWADLLPVVLVAPETAWPGSVQKKESRISNARILEVVPNRGNVWGSAAKIQVAQLLSDMKRANVKRPILWIYNAFFLEAFCNLPAAMRVHHVSENYFDYPSMSLNYLNRVSAVSRAADLNVAVSEGCARPLQGLTKSERILVATNGCDFKLYGREVEPDRQFALIKKQFRKLAVFAGVVSDRLDFDLIKEAAIALPDTAFVLIGPVTPSAKTNAGLKDILTQQNVRKFDEVPPERLPSIYRAADVGFVPYVTESWIARNGFPLKVLEMAATGLPVVTTLMDPLLAISPPLRVAQNGRDFVTLLATADRSNAPTSELRSLAARNDYDIRFRSILESLDRVRGLPSSEHFSALPNLPVGRTLERVCNSERFNLVALAKVAFYRTFPVVSRLLDRLPLSLRDGMRKIKRRVFN